MTPFVAVYFDCGPKIISDPSFVSTLVEDYLVSKNVYRGCVVYYGRKETMV